MSSVGQGQRNGERRRGKETGNTTAPFESLGNRDEPYPPAAPLGQVTNLRDGKLCGCFQIGGPTGSLPEDSLEHYKDTEREWTERSHADGHSACISGNLRRQITENQT